MKLMFEGKAFIKLSLRFNVLQLIQCIGFLKKNHASGNDTLALVSAHQTVLCQSNHVWNNHICHAVLSLKVS